MNMSVIGRRGIENNENTVQEERLKKPTNKGRQEIKECVITERGKRLTQVVKIGRFLVTNTHSSCCSTILTQTDIGLCY
jgi:hypothetical protein